MTYTRVYATFSHFFAFLQLLAGIVLLDRLRLNDARRVTFLPVLALRSHRPGHVARTQSERGSQRRQRSYQHGDDNLNDLFLGHDSPPSA